MRWWRRKLALIRYYSANREHTAWTRAMDMSLLLSLLLAVPAAWYADENIWRSESSIVFVGHLIPEDEGGIEARRFDDEGTGSLPPANPENIGSFRLQMEQGWRGFPLRSTRVLGRPTLLVNNFEANTSQVDPQLEQANPIRLAITELLTAKSDDEDVELLLNRWRDDAAVGETNLLAWAANAALWWFMLFASLGVAIFLARFVTIMAWSSRDARRAMLEADGKCPHCTYDLRGLEFSDRCPECGNLLY